MPSPPLIDLALYTARLAPAATKPVAMTIKGEDDYPPGASRTERLESACDQYRLELMLKPEVAKAMADMSPKERIKAEEGLHRFQKDVSAVIADLLGDALAQNLGALPKSRIGPREIFDHELSDSLTGPLCLVSGNRDTFTLALPHHLLTSEKAENVLESGDHGHCTRLHPFPMKQRREAVRLALEETGSLAADLAKTWVDAHCAALRRTGTDPDVFLPDGITRLTGEAPARSLRQLYHNLREPIRDLTDPLFHGHTGRMVTQAALYAGLTCMGGPPAPNPQYRIPDCVQAASPPTNRVTNALAGGTKKLNAADFSRQRPSESNPDRPR